MDDFNFSESVCLSVRQPWAAMLVHGLAKVEIRMWKTPVRNRILIHASKRMDCRDWPWQFIPKTANDPVAQSAIRTEGFVGSASLVDVRRYGRLSEFAADRELHKNPDECFAPGVFGFVFAAPAPCEFVPFVGRLGFFRPGEILGPNVGWREYVERRRGGETSR